MPVSQQGVVDNEPESGSGSINGPSSGTTTDNAIVRWDGGDASTLQNSLVTIDDSGNIYTPGNCTVDGELRTPWGNLGRGIAVGQNARAGDYSVAIGYGTGSTEEAFTSVGYGASSGYGSAAFGVQANAGWQGIAIGFQAFTTNAFGNGNVAIGNNSQATHEGSVALGPGAVTSKDYQLKMGSSIRSPIRFVTFETQSGTISLENENGGYLTISNARKIHVTTGNMGALDASGSNASATDLNINPGLSTGNATPAKIRLKGTATGSSGSTAQTASDVAIVHTSTRLEVLASEIDFTNLPTSDPGVPGRLYRTAGAVMISI